MTTIIPTPGRMIWFQPHHSLGLGPVREDRPLAATVTGVNEDGTVNLCAYTFNGNPTPIQEVPIIDPSNPPEGLDNEALMEGGWAYWMPYQKAAAEKAADGVTASATLTSTPVPSPAAAPAPEAPATSTLDGVGAGGAKDPV